MKPKRLPLLFLLTLLPFTAPQASEPSTGWVLIAPPFDVARMKELNAAVPYTTLGVLVMAFDESAAPPTDGSWESLSAKEKRTAKALNNAFLQSETLVDYYLWWAKDTLDTGRPISEWRHIRAFDSAHACEKVRTDFITYAGVDVADLRSAVDSTVESSSDKATRSATAYVSARASRCVPTSALY